MNNQEGIVIENLNKYYDDFHALKEFSLNIKRGEIFGLLGPNGAGKSTLIGILTGIVIKSSGIAKVFGKCVEKDYIETRSKIGVVPQETISDGYFTIERIMEFQSGFYGIEKNEERIEEILKRLSLWDKKDCRVEHLSGGMKRRLLVAKALVHKPEFFILDEPTAGVDVYLRVHLWEYVREINQNGTTILLTTHYIEEAEKLCDRVGIMNNGNLLMVDSVEKIIERTSTNNLEEAFIKLTGDKNDKAFSTI